MNFVKQTYERLVNAFRREDGATMVEYGLIVAAIAMIVVIGALALGNGVDAKFDKATTCVANPATPNAC